jgi:hypothetical protein
MPKIRDCRIRIGRKNRNNNIREYFAKRYNDGIRYEVIVSEIIHRWGLSESTINQIVKSYGNYNEE